MNIGFHLRCASHYHTKLIFYIAFCWTSLKGEQPPAQLPQPSSVTSNALVPPQLATPATSQ